MANVGFRIYTKITRPPKELVEAFRGLATPNIADNMSRFFCVDADIRPMSKGHLLGTAFTVRARPGDNLMFHKALDLAQPGDVIVVAGQGEMSNSLCGEIMVRYAIKKNLAGFLIDGAIRDSGPISELDFPVYARGAQPKGPYKDGPGEINVPVACGGVVIQSGDILVGDQDGVVVIRPEDAEDILAKTKAIQAKEAGIFTAIENGTWDRTWVNKTLQEKGCEIIE
jgi:regulator of RNase E activity RraA